jgi:HAE1 family hydrophobic/amphiphilic exporter-1
MDALTRLSIRRPLTMLMIIVTLVIMGYQGYTYLKLDRWPSVDIPIVTIVTRYAGASPEDIEDQVVKPIEDAVASISGIDELTSRATEGMAIVTITFVEGTDGGQAAIDVERQVATVSLPEEADDPTIIKADTGATPIMVLTLNGPQGQAALFDLADNELKARLQAVSGVASVNISGGREREIQINADPAKLAAYSLPLSEVQQAVANNNVTGPAGNLDQARLKKTIRTVGEFTNLAEIENTVVKSGEDGGGQVYLKDVASVQEGFKDQETIFRFNGLDAVSLSVTKTSDGNTVEVADKVRKVVEEFQQELPPGAELTIVTDNSTFVRDSVAAVIEDLGLAIIITGLVILVFLHTIRSTFIVLLAIPTSLISTMLVMWILDFSLNQLTLLAMTLVIGILVDDSIVVLENIERHLKMHKPPKQAALEGRAEIGFAALAITLVDVIVYLPVAFTSGIIGQFIFSYGITIVISTLFSLFVAFTLTPMLAAYWLRDESKPEKPPRGLGKVLALLFKPVSWLWDGFLRLFEAGFNLLTQAYAATLRFCLANVWTQSLVVVVAIVALAGGIYLVIGGVVRSEFVPQEDDGQIVVTITMPAGTNLATTDQAARLAEQIILRDVPEAATIRTRVGSSSSTTGFAATSTGANGAQLDLKLIEKAERTRNTTAIANALRPALEQIPEALTSVTLASSIGGNASSAIQVRLFGPDQNTLIDLTNQAEAVIKTIPGAVDVVNTDAARALETKLVVDRQRAVDLGLSPGQVNSTMRTALSGSKVGDFNPPDGSDKIDMTLRLAENTRQDQSQLMQVPLAYRQGREITLGQVAQPQDDLAAALITRANRQRVLTIGSGVTAGYGSGDVTNAIEAALNEQLSFPAGYGFQFIGESDTQRDAFSQLLTAIALSIGLIYILLVALYQSWLQPLAIMFSLPVTLVGAFGGLLLSGNSLNFFSLLGIVFLIGIVTKNAILIVDFTNQLREEQSYPTKKALVEAGRLRLRPVLMTTGALVFALLPVLLGSGAGAESRAPMAAVIVGGNISSTLLTLILVPVIYNFFDWGGGLASRVLSRIVGTDAEVAPVLPHPPAPQSGVAISLNPATPQSGADPA